MVQLSSLSVIVKYVKPTNTQRRSQLVFYYLLKIRQAHLNTLLWTLLHTFR